MKICDFVLPEINHILEQANFTEDERRVFVAFSRGETTENVAEICNMSVSTTKRIKSRIWAKIERIEGL